MLPALAMTATFSRATMPLARSQPRVDREEQVRVESGYTEARRCVVMTMITESSNPYEGDAERMADLFGPGQIDQSIRQAVQFCWVALPKERRTVEELEKQLRRLLERALKDFREDREAFGK
jgi:hypothetical protein